MARRPLEFTRRVLLGMTAAGAAGFALAPRADADAGQPSAGAGTGSATLAELEARAMGLTPPVFLLETAVPQQFTTTAGSSMTIDSGVHHAGNASLRWDYASRATLAVSAPLNLVAPSGGNGADIGANVNTLGFWVYQFKPSSGTLRIEAGRGQHTDAWCDMHLDFTGWRTAWIRYQDMNGNPRQDMDTLRFVAPKEPGTLYLDYLIVNQQLRSNFPTPDRQAPFVNPEVRTGDNEHWLDLLWFAELDARPLPAPAPTAAQLADVDAVTAAYDQAIRKNVKVTSDLVDQIANAVNALGVPPSGGTGGGGRVILGYQNAIWPPAIADDFARLSPATPLKKYADEMFTVAAAYGSTTDVTLQGRLADLYLRMLEHLWDQGWDEGSCQGTIHHLGYQASSFYFSVWLMRDLLREQKLLEHAKKTLAWLVGIGRTRQDAHNANRFYNGIFDIFNTTLMGMLGSALLEEDAAQKIARVQLVQHWLDQGIAVSPGIEDGFKDDLATFHHVGHYPAYARDGFTGGSPALSLLAGTGFAVSQESHQRWNDSLLAMRFYANETDWPLALSNRHPTGTDGLNTAPFQAMTTAGSPDGKHRLDPAMGAAFLRLMPAKPTPAQMTLAAQLRQAGVSAEPAPTGCQVMNHAALVSHRREDWLVSVRGHNRYLWSTEIYPGNNEYGRYVTYGQVQVLGGGNPVTNVGSGFLQPGWDWNRYPGTTTIHLPYDRLVADLSSAGEEMLLTDQQLGGGGAIEGQNGAFMMLLHENAKYDGSFYAHKSVFLFDNRVIALGSDIVNDDQLHPTETTMFQCYLADQSVPTQDSRFGPITSTTFSDSRALGDAVWLVDPQHVGYYVPSGQQLAVSRAMQAAPDQSGAAQASQLYTTALLDHGTRPRNARYEYAMVVGASPETMAAFARDMKDGNAAPYSVLRQDRVAHAVYDRATQITGCAVFEPTKSLDAGIVRAVDTPSIVLVRPNSGALTLSVTDPDLRLYDGPDRSEPTVSPFGVPWRDSRGQGSTITVEVEGRWKSTTQGVSTTAGSRTTRVAVRCSDGLPTELALTEA